MSFIAGKLAVVTGANSGIGFQTVRELAGEASEVIMICRSRERGEQAREQILKEYPQAVLTLLIADLSSPSSISVLMQEMRKRYDRISLLVNNAGGIFYNRLTAEDGLEYTFALNHMGYFRTTAALLPLLEKGRPSRVINVSSEAHRVTPLDFDDLQQEKHYRPFIAYGQSKLANILYTRELARRYAKLLQPPCIPALSTAVSVRMPEAGSGHGSFQLLRSSSVPRPPGGQPPCSA
jgi:NAD(P)-dependent dehydrogenase (short-subunit alcohol dehydrogenase family)